MDTSTKRRRRWAIEIKRRIAEESFEGSTSVAQLAQKYAVNANQIFKWRKDYREERLENSNSINLLPVTVSKEVVEAANPRNSSYQAQEACRSNSPAERSLRALALRRKNCLFAGSDRGGESTAPIYSLIGTQKLNGLNPESYLRNVLSRVVVCFPQHRFHVLTTILGCEQLGRL